MCEKGYSWGHFRKPGSEEGSPVMVINTRSARV